MNVVLSRKYQEYETLGSMFVLMDYNLLFSCKSLELPWLDNERQKSCIPAGTYEVEKYDSPNKGLVFLVKNVPGRDSIEIHSGNYKRDTLGCILVGSGFEDINNDGNLDIIESRKTLDRLLGILNDNFKLIII
jgi:hypothetical protein